MWPASGGLQTTCYRSLLSTTLRIIIHTNIIPFDAKHSKELKGVVNNARNNEQINHRRHTSCAGDPGFASDGLDDGGSNHLWNVGKFLQDYMAQCPNRQSLSSRAFFELGRSRVWVSTHSPTILPVVPLTLETYPGISFKSGQDRFIPHHVHNLCSLKYITHMT
jgi:hypothetical protein